MGLSEVVVQAGERVAAAAARLLGNCLPVELDGLPIESPGALEFTDVVVQRRLQIGHALAARDTERLLE